MRWIVSLWLVVWVGLYAREDYSDKSVRFLIPIEKVMRFPGEAQIVRGKAYVGDVDVECFVGCRHLAEMEYTLEELTEGEVDVMRHLEELVPEEGIVMGLVTLQNGINTSSKEFKEMVRSVADQISEGTLVIALHNETDGFLKDLKRMRREIRAKETGVVLRTRRLLQVVVEKLDQINPQMLWLHITHSEGSLISANAIQGMAQEGKELLKKHLYAFSQGGVKPISNQDVFRAVNIYSKKDHAANRYARRYFRKPEYDIKKVPSESGWLERSGFIADHSFMGTTYLKTRNEEIADLRERYGFYQKHSC